MMELIALEGPAGKIIQSKAQETQLGVIDLSRI